MRMLRMRLVERQAKIKQKESSSDADKDDAGMAEREHAKGERRRRLVWRGGS